MKICYIDVETTGLDSAVCSVWQLAGQIHVNGQILKFDYRIKPFEGAILSDYALKMNKLTPEILDSFPEEAEVYSEFIKTLNKTIDKYDRQDKMLLIGYNIAFDEKFIRALFERQGNKYFGSYFWYPPIDVMNLAAFVLRDQRHKLPNFKLASVCRYFGIPIEEDTLHDAQYDIELTIKLYEVLERFSNSYSNHLFTPVKVK